MLINVIYNSLESIDTAFRVNPISVTFVTVSFVRVIENSKIIAI